MAASSIQLFNQWSYDDVEISDISLEDYIAVNKKYCVYLPHTAGRYARKRFRKVHAEPSTVQTPTAPYACMIRAVPTRVFDVVVVIGGVCPVPSEPTRDLRTPIF